MRRCFALLMALMLSTSILSFGQKAKGDKCYKDYDYHDAITFYKKAISSNPNDTASLVRLATCYRIIRDYDNAEKYYAMAADKPGISESAFFYYGEILKNNGKIDDAMSQFLKCTILVPKDSAAAREVRYCNLLKKKFYVTYQVTPVKGINTGNAEFCPVAYNDDIVFISDRKEDIVNMSENNFTGGNFFKIYVSKPEHDGFGTPKEFPLKANKTQTQYNIGPVSFSADGNEMFFTEVAAKRKKNYVNQAKIYYCIKSGNHWGSPKPFPYNSDKYSTMDPSLSADGKMLFFASNMPGGMGGTDIYVCTLDKNNKWSRPKNLGKDVNTQGNEAFPYMRSDGVLFFSSNRHFNYGGFDIFSAKLANNKWTDVQNLGPDVNSPKDDFGIFFNSNNRTGYFSSNRKDGQGQDDIYSFLYIGDYMPLKGAVLFSYNIHDPVPAVDVHLLDVNGNVVADTKTDKNGVFVFDNLKPDEKYMVKVNDNDPRFAGKKRFYLADSTGKIVAVTLFSNKGGKFVFTQLPADLTSMPRMNNLDKGVNLAGNLLQGDSSKPVANVKISVLNANGDVMQTATTNAFGAFVFTQLPPDENYEFKVDENGDTKLIPRAKIVLTDKNGNTLKTFYVGPDGKFNFQVLASDTTAISHMTVDDPQLRLGFSNILLSDQKKPLSKIKISVIDKSGKVLQSTVTGSAGEFSFTNLPPDESSDIQVDGSDPRLKNMSKLYITDAKRDVMKEMDLNNGSFTYELLPADKKEMGSIYVYDPWIEALNLKNKKNTKTNKNMYIIENIYYDYNKWNILPAAAHVLDKVVEVMKNDPSIKIELDAFTDPRGSADFNMQLSQKRADAAVAYIVSHGIAKSRVKGKGLGETHPLNNCGDPNVHCTEAQYAVNRRTEFKIIRN